MSLPGKRKGFLFWFLILLLVGAGIFALLKLRNTVIVENPPVPEAERIKIVMSTDPAAETSEPKVAVQEGQRIEVLDNSLGYLNVRDASSTRGVRIDRIKPGEQYDYTEIENNWYHIVLSEGKDGWVSGQYVKEVEAVQKEE